jgi:hypothetical protein
MARITDANILYAGSEPKFSAELSQLDLMKTLSWYAQNKDTKDAHKWACDFIKKNHKLDVSPVIKIQSSTFGFVCRIVANGGVLPTKEQNWLNGEIEKLRDRLKNKKEPDIVEDVPKIFVPNIQDRIKEKASECIGELEGQLDELIVSNFSANSAPYAVMHTMEIKGVHAKHISDWFKTKRIEFDDVLHTDDAEVKEGYSNFSKPQLKKVIAWCDQVILDCGKIAGEAVKSRKPRKRKTKTPEQLVAKVKVMDEHKEFKLKSVPAKDIIGAMQLWVFNTKNRKLGCYHAIDADGLSIKGSSIINFNESKSVQKTLRKPEATLPEILKGGKVYLRNALDNIRAVESGLTGRLNADIILVRVVK